MPPLLLDDEEAIAIAVGLRTAARASVTGIEETAVRALVKLEQVLPAHLRRRVGALGSATFTLAGRRPDGRPAAPDGDRRGLPRLASAFASPTEAATAPTAAARSSPTRSSTIGRRWYLVAWDRRREDWRTFRIDRLTRPASTGVRFTRRTLPAKDAAAYVEQSITGAPHRFEALRHSARRRGGDHEPRPGLLGRDRADRRAHVRVQDGRRRPRWLALRIAMLGVDFEVHEPPELVEHLRALAMRLRRAVR